jgi:hypothetical protein
MTTLNFESKFLCVGRAVVASLNDTLLRCATVLMATVLMLAFAYAANAQVAMAPPIQIANAPSPSGDTVFNWTEVPQNQDVLITRAVFDQGGYQLYDTVGETILVPFTNDNLYVMKFAESTDGQIHFTNTGSAPVLTIPAGVGIENATVPGSFWYPIPYGSSVQTPEYMGMAPSWDDFVDMGWYPGMVVYGGYCWSPDVAAWPILGFAIDFGANQFFGWGGYSGYCHDHGAPYHTGYWHHGIYGGGSGHGKFGGVGGRLPKGSDSHHSLFPGTGPATKRAFEGGTHSAIQREPTGGFGGRSIAPREPGGAFGGRSVLGGSTSGRVFRGTAGSGYEQFGGRLLGTTKSYMRSLSDGSLFSNRQSSGAFHSFGSGTFGGFRSSGSSLGASHPFAYRSVQPSGGSHSFGSQSLGGAHSFGGGFQTGHRGR